MRISYNWLKEYIDLESTPQALAHELTMLGLAVDAVTTEGDDYVLEVDVTSNRPDCLNHVGVARELAALYGKDLRLPPLKLPPRQTEEQMPYSIQIRDPKLCYRYVGLLMKDVRVGTSPEWLQKRLIAIGQRPVNNIVDITNYVLFELGHPLHAFDFAKLRGGRIIVRAAAGGESIVTLDGILRQLDTDMLVIADAERPVAIAGIMGGAETEISEDTEIVLLESAYFHPLSVRRTARRLGLSTEASYRFERGADIEAASKAIARAAQLICDVAGGKVCADPIDVYPRKIKRKPITLRHKRACQLIGVELSSEFIEDKLRRLEFSVLPARKGIWKVTPPSHRVDVEIEVDLIEEIARHYGYDKIPSALPAGRAVGRFLIPRETENIIRQALRSIGYTEAINWSFVSPEDENRFRYDNYAFIQVSNPISEVDSVLSTSLLPGLLKTVRWNFNHGIKNVKVFELGKAYFWRDGKPAEAKHLGIAATGNVNETSWIAKPEPVSFFHLKGVLEALFEQLRLEGWQIVPTRDVPYLHPNVSACIYLGQARIGVLGRLHPECEAVYKFKQEVFVAELNIEGVMSRPLPEPRYRPLPRFPSVYQDLSFTVDNDLEFRQVEDVIRSCGIAEIASFELFDVYRGQQLPADKKSISLRLRYQRSDRTLTQKEVNEFNQKIIDTLRERLGAKLRQ